MNNSALYKTVGKAIRVEYDNKSGALYLVFELIDEDFKKRVKEDWNADIELELEDRKLLLKEE